MGDVRHLHDAHEQAQLLLPWRANGTLEPGDAAILDAHLEQCAACRADLAAEVALREHYAGMPAELPVPLDLPPALRRSRLRFLRRRVPLGWALAAPLAAAAAAVALFVSVPSPAPAGDGYRLLGTPGERGSGNAIVLFSPDTTARDLRAALAAADAQVVAGPTASGAFILRVAPDERAGALARMRASRQVLLAEPIDKPDGS
jgi:hypothetical protein